MSILKKYIKRIVSGVISDEFASVRETMNQEFASVLHDVTYRMQQMRELGGVGERRIQTSDLNLASHMIDGYTVADNSPSAGFVAWSDINIVYKGVTYTLANGNTNKKYLWWKFSATPNTALQVSDTKPVLTNDDVLVGINDGGKFTSTMTAGKLTPGGALMDGSIGSGELAAGAVITSKIANGAIGSTQMGDGAVTEVKLGSGAVTSAKIGSGAVGSTALASGAVTSGKIASGVVGSTELANGAVTSGKLGTGAVGSGNIANGAVGGAQLGAGSIGEDKLNLATHFLF